jgi:hypothetical protein
MQLRAAIYSVAAVASFGIGANVVSDERPPRVAEFTIDPDDPLVQRYQATLRSGLYYVDVTCRTPPVRGTCPVMPFSRFEAQVYGEHVGGTVHGVSTGIYAMHGICTSESGVEGWTSAVVVEGIEVARDGAVVLDVKTEIHPRTEAARARGPICDDATLRLVRIDPPPGGDLDATLLERIGVR